MSKYLNSSIFFLLLGIVLLFNLASCTKFVQIGPPSTEITGSTVYSNSSSAAAVMSGLYSNMVANPQMTGGYHSIGYSMGLASDELTNYDPNNIWQVQFYENALSSITNHTSNYYFWTELYSDIYVTNAVLEGLASSTALSVPAKQQLTGEAEFMRAFLHFYATNLYGDIPLVLTTNYQTNNSIYRTPQAQVYQQIVADLKNAQANLSVDFVDASGKTTTERTRPNQGAAAALLARVYLYMGKNYWDSAETNATTVIKNSAEYSLDSLNNVFLANSTEAIWQLQPVNTEFTNSLDAPFYILTAPPPSGNIVAISPYLTGAFESGDERRTDWVGAFTSDSITYYYLSK